VLRRILFTNSMLCLMLIPSVWAQAPVGAPAGVRQMGEPPVHSPVVSDDDRVTVRFRAPNAKEVILNLQGCYPMQKNDQGIWSFTTDPLTPEIYGYSIVVDGLSLADPGNPLVSPRFQAAPSSLVVVPGPTKMSWEMNEDVAHGVVSHQWYKSAK
jgi:hypothetical protein